MLLKAGALNKRVLSFSALLVLSLVLISNHTSWLLSNELSSQAVEQAPYDRIAGVPETKEVPPAFTHKLREKASFISNNLQAETKASENERSHTKPNQHDKNAFEAGGLGSSCSIQRGVSDISMIGLDDQTSEGELKSLIEALAQVPETGTLLHFEQLLTATDRSIQKFLVKLTWNGHSPTGYTFELYRKTIAGNPEGLQSDATTADAQSSVDFSFVKSLSHLTQTEAMKQIEVFIDTFMKQSPGSQLQRDSKDLVLLFTQARISSLWSDKEALDASAVIELRGKSLFRYVKQGVSCYRAPDTIGLSCNCAKN